MTERSARFGLPFILPGQAQKEVFHNEALAALDGLVHAAVSGSAAGAAGRCHGRRQLDRRGGSKR
jgi:hypothetical protein